MICSFNKEKERKREREKERKKERKKRKKERKKEKYWLNYLDEDVSLEEEVSFHDLHKRIIKYEKC